MQPYKKYKPTGLEWLSQIPEHWEVKKLKYAATVQPSNVDKKSVEGEQQVLLCNYMDVYRNEFIDDSISFMKATASDEQIEKFALKNGDVLITKDSETPEDIAVPALVIYEQENLICGYHLAQIRAQDGLIGPYLFRLFQCKKFNTNFEKAANGITRYGLGVDAIKDVEIVLPPLEEQEAIADYLNTKTAQIDQLIINKRKLIALLKDERIALINEAVTKGTNHNVKMKSSGVDWLDNIPQHWELKKLKYIVSKIGSGVTPSGGANVYVKQGIPLLRSQNIYFDGLYLDDVAYITDEIHNSMSGSKVQPGDVLLNITGGSIGRCFYYDGTLGEANVNQHVCIVRPNHLILTNIFIISSIPHWVNYRLKFYKQVRIEKG